MGPEQIRSYRWVHSGQLVICDYHYRVGSILLSGFTD